MNLEIRCIICGKIIKKPKVGQLACKGQCQLEYRKITSLEYNVLYRKTRKCIKKSKNT